MAISVAALDTGQSSPTMNTSKCWHQQDSSYNNIIVLHEHNLMCAIKYPPLFVLFTSVVTRGFFIGGGSSIISRPYKVSPRNGDDGVMRRRLYTRKTSYKMKNLGVLEHLTKRFQLLGLPTHLSGRRQTTLAFLRRSNSCDSSFLNNFINEVMVEDEMNNFINEGMCLNHCWYSYFSLLYWF